VKELVPMGCARAGLLACNRARRLLAGDVPEDLGGVLLAEGGTDWLRAALAVAAGDAPPLAVLGGVAGSWKQLPEALGALPPGVPVYAAHDPDGTGDRYAEECRRALASRPVFRVGLRRGEDGRKAEDLDARLTAEPRALRDGEDESWGLLRVAREAGPMTDPTATTAPGEDPERADAVDPARAAPWTLAACWERWRRRLEAGPAAVLWPWPGTPATMPTRSTTRLDPAELLPLDMDRRPRWDPLWRLAGPLWPDRTVVLVGGTGRGKTAFAVQVAEAAACAGAPVLYASAELGTDELLARLVAVRARSDRVAWRDLLRFHEPRDVEALAAAVERLAADCPGLYLWEPMGHDRAGKGLQDAARIVSAAAGGAPILVVVDYLQRFTPPGNDAQRAATSEVSGALRDLCRPDGLGAGWPGAAVVALSSTARANYEHFSDCEHLTAAWEGGEVPATKKNGKQGTKWIPPVELVGMGKETGEIEHDCSLLLCMTTDKPGYGDRTRGRPSLVVVAKNRHGETGTAALMFHPAPGRFCELREPPPREEVEL